ncbi:nucleoside 2-deoxyribosyltransferase [Neokomagataea thailandica]|uniref:Nucleoside 2-deoxyribosyltransferase n=1 Tax=Neokomagataea tanensis NBRC 106556 TaxID=1223519 RepID=A0ABQ0QK40_9PROT|nr:MULTISPECIES: nucleoside 2-deoxyribosyltransferase [Neokomagataea]GBR47656.1 nucleoside 2-deoxyribosyltransferase [Neokomagataea tanensis NBRC 106556]
MTRIEKKNPKVYLAGDLVFRPDALSIFRQLKLICADYGLIGVAPFDGQEEARHLPPGRETILAFVRADRDLMDECDAGLFCVDPFRRSADMDPGTAVEIGYMHAQRKPLEAYTVDRRSYPQKVEDYWGSVFKAPLRPRVESDVPSSGAMEDPDGMLVHSEGMLQNGMVDGFIMFSGGKISSADDFFDAFCLAAQRLAGRL